MGVLFLFFGVLCFFCFSLPFVHILKNKSTFCFTCKNSMKRGCSDVYHAFVAVNILGLFLCGCAEFLSSAELLITVHFIPPEHIFHRTFTFIYGTVVAFATLNQYVSHKIVQCHSQRTECLPKFQHGHKLKKIKNKCNFNRDIHDNILGCHRFTAATQHVPGH